MDGRPTWTDCDEAGDYVVPNLLSPMDLVFRPDNMDETVPHICYVLEQKYEKICPCKPQCYSRLLKLLNCYGAKIQIDTKTRRYTTLSN